MNKLSRILSVMLCFAPVAFASAGPVATTAGSNLTAYNPSNANNNQWATMSNGRYDGNVSAKADFGNCNALILRCAQPKCANGGCAEMSIASAIVAGCVQSNKSCAQYGDDLVSYMSAQLVASSNAKLNEQNLAAQQAAATAAAEQSQQQMQEMQYQMQQMQQQMAQQQAESQQQLQEALAQQAAQSQAAIESMKSAATEAAKENEAGISAYQQEAIDRGISADVLERQKITGQIMTEIENATVSLNSVKKAMDAAFEYAKCDARGNNCDGPKRIKKWRELAADFLTPYDNTVDKIYDALVIAQTVGVDLSDIYMMLNDSCNRWGQYMCPKIDGGEIEYREGKSPQVCPKGSDTKLNRTEYNKCVKKETENKKNISATDLENIKRYCEAQHTGYDKPSGGCQDCTLLKILTNQDEVYEGWVNPSVDDTSNGTVVACASSILDSSKLFTRRTKNKNGAGLVDIDKLDTWLRQNEPRKTRGNTEPYEYCDASKDIDVLEESVLSKSIPKKQALCVDKPGIDGKRDDDCPFISPVYAICDTHLYNAGQKTISAAVQDINDCTVSARQSAVDDKDPWKKKFTEHREKILWARFKAGAEDRSAETCEVKFCEENYKPDPEGKGCVEDKENYAAGKESYEKLKADYDHHNKERFGEMKEIIALKTTVISQQMYKQYEYLSATLRRLKIQLEKATLTATLEAAGAKSEGSSSGLLGGGSNDDKTIHLAGANNCSNFMDFDSAYNCLQNNASLVKNNVSSNAKKACLQLQETVSSAASILAEKSSQDMFITGTTKPCANYQTSGNTCKDSNKANITSCANALNMAVMNEKRVQSQKNKTYSMTR